MFFWLLLWLFSMFPSLYSHKKRKDSAERMMLPRGRKGRHPSDLFPSFLTGTTNSRSKCWWKSEDGPGFWTQPSTLGSRSELENPTATARRCSEFNQDHQALGWARLTSAQWGWLKIQITDNTGEHFTLDNGMCWVNTLPSCKPDNHCMRKGQMHQLWSEDSEFSKALKTKRFFPKFGTNVFGAKT